MLPNNVIKVDEAVREINRNPENGSYSLISPLGTDTLETMDGFRWPEWKTPGKYDNEDSGKTEAYSDRELKHLVEEYGRLNGVSVSIIQLRMPQSRSMVEFSGSFSAIYSLYLELGWLDDAIDARDVVRSGVDSKVYPS